MTDRRVIRAPVCAASRATRTRSALCIGPPTSMVQRQRQVGIISHSPPTMAQTKQYP